jgi:putative nucleotidyltransferase with HDIG domain
MPEKIPDREACLRLMDEHEMLPNIRDHSLVVTEIALTLADNLSGDETVNRDLVEAGALLHDITKTRSVQTGEIHHDITGGELLRGLGMREVAEVVESHVHFRDYSHEGPVEERELVFYADKRVQHDRVVSVNERFNDLVKRYGILPEYVEVIENNRRFTLMVEEKLAGRLTAPLEELVP